MKNNSNNNSPVELRSSPRNYTDIFYSVEITITANDNISQCYKFKLRDISESGMCVLVNEKSRIISNLKPGDIIDVEYCPIDYSHKQKKMKTKIKHITHLPQKKDTGDGHYYVGLLIMEEYKTSA